jgi:hypothetical protein
MPESFEELTSRVQKQQRELEFKELQEKGGISLEKWPEDKVNAPALLLRSALFGIVKRGKRKHLDDVEISSWQGTTIRYKGDELDQSDLDVWLACVELHRHAPLGSPIQIREAEFLHMIDRDTGGSNREWLRKVLRRLTACSVEIQHGDLDYFGSMVFEGARDRKTKLLNILINPKIAQLFSVAVRQDKKIRSQLKTQLSKWFYGYLCSHESTINNPHKIMITNLMRLSGAGYSRVAHFKSDLVKCLKELHETGAILEWGFTKSGCLEVVKTPNALCT